MASSSITVVNLADENEVFNLVGQTEKGGIFKVTTRPLNLPKSLEFQYNIGAPGALGNDRLVVTFSDSVANSTTGKVVTARAKLEVSVPRDSAITSTHVETLLSYVASLLTDARVQYIADAMVP